MARGRGIRGIDAKLVRLRKLGQETAGPSPEAELREALADRFNLVAAEAATIVGTLKLAALAPELVAAFARLMEDPEETDKGCRAKLAIVEALNQLDYQREDVFLRGITHEQGLPYRAHLTDDDDHAAPLRGCCAFGLARNGHADLLLLLVDLLRDRARTARVCAAQALGVSGKLAAIPLLRFKALNGDQAASVVVECLNALMQLDAPASIPFVGRFLGHGKEEIAEGAALALGESRRPEALDFLKRALTGSASRALDETLLLAMSLSRLPAALDFLFDIVAHGKEPSALAALIALAIHRHNPKVKDRAAELSAKGSQALQKLFQRKFREE